MKANLKKENVGPGLLHYHFGKGSGKTTSAFGMILRSLGHNFKPVIFQFLKKSNKGQSLMQELKILENFGLNISDLMQEYDEYLKITNESKGFDYGEYKTLTEILKVPVIQLGTPSFIFTGKKPSVEHLKKAEFGLKLIKRIIESSKFDILVLDEILTAVHLNIVNKDQLVEILTNSLDERKIEIILTGREKIAELVEISDYITHFEEIKHPFQKGIKARKGIEF
jgi:cob(I)alamin adenosyltransferase